jgi:hypothetical protein
MKLSEIKQILNTLEDVNFQLANGKKIPDHFHVTEVGVVTKHFIDCGGTVRHEKVANFQLWEANDYDHRLKPQKLLNIIKLSEETIGMEDLEIEVEYQSDTIGKYGLEFNNSEFILTSKYTNCLASDACGIPLEKMKINLSDLTAKACCTPGGGCC